MKIKTEELIDELRGLRIKHGTDYCYLIKRSEDGNYNDMIVLCKEVFQYRIEDVATTLGFNVTEWIFRN